MNAPEPCPLLKNIQNLSEKILIWGLSLRGWGDGNSLTSGGLMFPFSVIRDESSMFFGRLTSNIRLNICSLPVEELTSLQCFEVSCVLISFSCIAYSTVTTNLQLIEHMEE